MDVDRGYHRTLEKPRGKNLAVSHYDKEVKPGLRDEDSTLFGPYLRRLIDSNSAILGKNLDRRRLQPMSASRGPVRLCNNPRNLVGALNQRAQRGDGKLRRAHEDHAHGPTIDRFWPTS